MKQPKPSFCINALMIALSCLLPAHALAAAEPTVKATIGAHPVWTQSPGIAFWILFVLTLFCAILTISRRNPVVAAICLVATLLSSAGIFLLLHASFMAAIQVLVYAGAIMVLFVLVVMSVEHPEHEEIGFLRGTMAKLIGIVAIGWLAFRVFLVLKDAGLQQPEKIAADWGTVSSISKLLFSDYLFPFEAISLLLLTSIVGAVVVTRRRSHDEARDSEVSQAERGAPRRLS